MIEIRMLRLIILAAALALCTSAIAADAPKFELDPAWCM